MQIFNNSKKVKKPSGKFLRVWAKNQWGLKFVEKILKFTYKNLNGKLPFFLFLSHLPGPLSFYTALENNTIFLQQFFQFRGGGAGKLPPPPCGRLCTAMTINSFVEGLRKIFTHDNVLN